MTDKYMLLPRRAFLQKGIGMYALFLLMPRKLLFFLMKLLKTSPNSCDDSKERLIQIAQRYGSEFGDIKPQGRRNNHGCV